MGTHTHHPWLVTEVVDGLQGVDAGETSILHAYDQVAEVLILGHAEGMLPDEHKVWPEGTGEKEKAAVGISQYPSHNSSCPPFPKPVIMMTTTMMDAGSRQSALTQEAL